jgi:hypothetical protein
MTYYRIFTYSSQIYTKRHFSVVVISLVLGPLAIAATHLLIQTMLGIEFNDAPGIVGSLSTNNSMEMEDRQLIHQWNSQLLLHTLVMAKGKVWPKKTITKVMDFVNYVQWRCNIVIFIDTHADANMGFLQHQGGDNRRSASVDKVCLPLSIFSVNHN